MCNPRQLIHHLPHLVPLPLLECLLYRLALLRRVLSHRFEADPRLKQVDFPSILEHPCDLLPTIALGETMPLEEPKESLLKYVVQISLSEHSSFPRP